MLLNANCKRMFNKDNKKEKEKDVERFKIKSYVSLSGVTSRKRPLIPVSDHIGLPFWLVGSGRFDCQLEEYCLIMSLFMFSQLSFIFSGSLF